MKGETDQETDSLLEAAAAAPSVALELLSPQIRAGETVADRYRLERPIGEGGMGIVWEATVLDDSGDTVALKFLKRAVISSDARRRFLREARAANAIKHPNVVQVHEMLELDDGVPVMVMELLEGESLAQHLDRLGALDVSEVAEIMIPVVSAVGRAHSAGIVHRDLKPHNIFLCKRSRTVKVLDFGIAKLLSGEDGGTASTALTGTGALIGTPCYMSPEQAFGERDIDHRADVWALGVILYECLSGVLPTQGANVGQIIRLLLERGVTPLVEVAPDVPADLVDLVGRMLTRKREARLADLHEVRGVLERYTEVRSESFERASVTDVASAPASEEEVSPASQREESRRKRLARDRRRAERVVRVHGSADAHAATAAPATMRTPSASTPPPKRRGRAQLMVGAIASLALVGVVVATLAEPPAESAGRASATGEPPGPSPTAAPEPVATVTPAAQVSPTQEPAQPVTTSTPAVTTPPALATLPARPNLPLPKASLTPATSEPPPAPSATAASPPPEKEGGDSIKIYSKPPF